MQIKYGETLVVVHFGELWLKGKNRNSYVHLLERNMREKLSGEGAFLSRSYDRLILRLTEKSDLASIRSKLSRTFGISGFEVSVTTEPKLESIVKTASGMLKSRKGIKCVKINSHRADKTLKFNSVDVIRKMIKEVEKLGLEADTKGYDTLLNINITKDVAYVSLDKEKGLGGLPVGSSGKGVVLLSGGIDSPVAAWYAMKRGVEPIYVHLHAHQSADDTASGKIQRLVDILSQYHPHCKVYYIPSHIFSAKSSIFGKYELVLLKSFMLRLAERVAKKEEASTIFTGESLGQVASQTAVNLGAEQYGIGLPVLRPLIGYDKEEIIKIARAIGTYDESIIKYKDVCSLTSKNPILSADPKKVRELASKMKMASIVTRSLKAASVVGN